MLMEINVVPPLWKTVWEFLNINVKHTIFILGIYPKGMNTHMLK